MSQTCQRLNARMTTRNTASGRPLLWLLGSAQANNFEAAGGEVKQQTKISKTWE